MADGNKPIQDRWTPDQEYIGVRIPDKMQIATLINEAKGDRTMAQFATDCQTSASTLSRAVNGKITKPMTTELIKSIAEHAVGNNARMFERLARANGLMPKEQFDAREARGKSRNIEFMEKRRSQETKAQNIIMTELINRGLPVKLAYKDNNELFSTYGQAMPYDFCIETDLGQGPIKWMFMLVPYTIEDVLGEGNVPVGYYLRRAMENMSGWFLTDVWEPEKLNNRLLTFLFIDGSVYMSFEDRLIGGPTVNTDISFVALDMEQEKVKFEIYMSRKDGEHHELIFSRPILSDETEEDDPWMIPGDAGLFGTSDGRENY